MVSIPFTPDPSLAVAVIVAVPSPIAYIDPSSEMLSTDVLSTDHLTLLFVAFDGNISVYSCTAVSFSITAPSLIPFIVIELIIISTGRLPPEPPPPPVLPPFDGLPPCVNFSVPLPSMTFPSFISLISDSFTLFPFIEISSSPFIFSIVPKISRIDSFPFIFNIDAIDPFSKYNFISS